MLLLLSLWEWEHLWFHQDYICSERRPVNWPVLSCQRARWEDEKSHWDQQLADNSNNDRNSWPSSVPHCQLSPVHVASPPSVPLPLAMSEEERRSDWHGHLVLQQESRYKPAVWLPVQAVSFSWSLMCLHKPYHLCHSCNIPEMLQFLRQSNHGHHQSSLHLQPQLVWKSEHSREDQHEQSNECSLGKWRNACNRASTRSNTHPTNPPSKYVNGSCSCTWNKHRPGGIPRWSRRCRYVDLDIREHWEHWETSLHHNQCHNNHDKNGNCLGCKNTSSANAFFQQLQNQPN